MKRKVLALTLLGATAVAGAAFAIQQDIDVSARMRVGLAFANQIDMDFTPPGEYINFYGTPAGTDYVTMGTDGSMTPNNAVFEPTTGTGTPGSVDVTGDGSSTVNITCTISSTLAHPSGTLITVDQLELQLDTGTAFQTGSPYSCSGLASVTPYQPTLDGNNTILMGGRLLGNSTIQGGLYTSTDTGNGGTPAQVRVLYQ